MRPTRAGFGILAVAVGLLLAGRLLGLLELYLLAAMLGVALLLGAAYTLASRLHLMVTRTATPARLRAGTSARIDVVLKNQGRRRTPALAAHDQLQNGRGASVLVAPIARGRLANIAYRLPAQQRGELLVGPLDLTIGDPLGLTRSQVRAADRTRLMVHARLIELDPLSAVAGYDPTAEQQPLRTLASAGDEFFALRPYVVGDELRRVHWRASARFDELVVRQEERPKTGRVTVLLDVASDAYSHEGFERAVSAALSALYAGFRGGDSLRFVTSGSPTPTDIKSRADLEGVDEQLALINPSASASLGGRLEELARSSRGGTLVVVTGAVPSSVEGAVQRAYRTFGHTLVIACERRGGSASEWVSVYDGDTDLRHLWKQAMSTALVG